MVRELAKEMEKPDPIVKWALSLMAAMGGIIGTLVLIQLSDIKESIDRNRSANESTRELVHTIREGFAVQQEIIDANVNVNADQEDRLRLLEQWQRAVNQ